MPVDPSIPLGFNPTQFGLNPLQREQLNALRFRRAAEQQQIQSQNALRQVMSDPSSIDPATGSPTPQTISRVMAINPDMGMEMQRNALALQEGRAKAWGAWEGVLKDGTEAAVSAYEAELPTGGPEAAQRAAQAEFSRQYEGFKSAGMPAELVRSLPTTFNYQRATKNLQTYAERQTAGRQERAGERQERAESERERHDLAVENRMAQAAEERNKPSDMTEEDKDYWAEILRRGGTLPPGLARTSAGSKLVQELMKRVPRGSTPGELISGRATVQADQRSLANLTRMTDAAVSFEATAIKNLNLALTLAPKAVPTNWGPWLNRWVMQGETMFGDKDVPPYVMAMLTGANEYAKIMSGSTGAQGSTVDSRREAAELFSPYLSKGQIAEVIKVAKIDMDNRKNSYREQLTEIQGRLKGQLSPTTEEKPKFIEGQIYKDAQGNRARYQNGQWVPVQ